MQTAIRANTIMLNGLMYGYDGGFEHTVALGGDRWFEWLEALYPEEARWIREHSTRRDVADSLGRHWQFDAFFTADPKVRRRAYLIVDRLKAKEYVRLEKEFCVKAARIWQTFSALPDKVC
jgi:hypothetical protein